MKKFLVLLLIVILVFSLVFVNWGRKKKKKITLGISFSDFATERWSDEDKMMKKLGGNKGAKVISQVANNDAKLQNDQIENMVLQGANVIIIIAEDSVAAAIAVDKAAENGIPCIAYDRLIKTNKLACYISFDNVEVGRQQARGVLKVKDKGRFVLLGGSPTDNNATLFRNGQMEILKPLINKGQIKVVADQWVDNWDPANALKIMENILTAQKNKIDAVVASNDGTALGALQAMKAQGLAGKVPISGQDATEAGCKSIVEGELTMTVFKDTRKLTPLAINIAMDLGQGKKVSGLKNYTLAELTLDDSLKGSVPCSFLKVIQVDKDNVYKEVIKSGFASYDEVYKDIPKAQRPPRP
jgi:D-xylose transport system substrate-binding protein